MTVTEEEAKDKWCPEVRADGDNRFVSKTGEILWGGRYCIGSACMFWRWEQPPYVRVRVDSRGYCGKAGGP